MWILIFLKDNSTVEIKLPLSPKSTSSRLRPLSSLTNSLRRLSGGQRKSGVEPLPPPLKLKQMHQHHSEDRENPIELNVIEEIQSGAPSIISNASYLGSQPRMAGNESVVSTTRGNGLQTLIMPYAVYKKIYF